MVVIRDHKTDEWMGKPALDAELEQGWEPFAVTPQPDHLYGLVYHLRRMKPRFS